MHSKLSKPHKITHRHQPYSKDCECPHQKHSSKLITNLQPVANTGLTGIPQGSCSNKPSASQSLSKANSEQSRSKHKADHSKPMEPMKSMQNDLQPKDDNCNKCISESCRQGTHHQLLHRQTFTEASTQYINIIPLKQKQTVTKHATYQAQRFR